MPATLSRPALLATMAERWDRRLVTVVAGPGFGKTTLLVEAMARASDGPAPPGVDLWLGCEPADADASHLVAGLAAAAGIEPAAAALDVAEICDALWARAPTDVCLVLDDVHEIGEGSESADLLAALIDELPANAHVVLASRHAVPVPTARLAAAGRLARVREEDLVLDDDELGAFADARGVSRDLVAATGGWPALAELAASVGTDMVTDYLWEEVLARLGDRRAGLLARLSIVGGGDDAVLTALAGRSATVEEIVAGVPLVLRSGDGWVVPHALWQPAARALLQPAEVDAACRTAAQVHRRAGRLDLALDLLIEAADWDGVIEVLREAALLRHLPAKVMGRSAALPTERMDEPIPLLAAAVVARDRGDGDAIERFVLARASLRASGDVEGEVAVLIQESLARWWVGDTAGLLELVARTSELAAAGHAPARRLDALARAATAHVLGDSAGVFAGLAEIDGELPDGWRVQAAWLKSVAHRRDGDLDGALAALEVVSDVVRTMPDHQHDVARARTRWLAGDVDAVIEELDRLGRVYEGTDTYLFAETTLESAAKRAVLGDAEGARDRLAAARAADPVTAVVVRFLALVADVALRVDDGDEEGAAALLRTTPEAAPGRHDSWYWRDRGATALPLVLLPEQRDGWVAEHRGPAHEPGVALAVALAAARDGDLGPVRALEWPEPGIVRAHLPAAWVVELAAWGEVATNPPPGALLRSVGPDARRRLAILGERRDDASAVARAANSLMARAPEVPGSVVRIEVLGPLVVRRGGEVLGHPHLRRARVRELLSVLVARPRTRREEVADLLWPDVDDPSGNLRTTLSYLRQVLEPDRTGSDVPYLLRNEGGWLVLEGGAHLEVDLWDLDRAMAAATEADARGAPAEVLAAARDILPLWRGEPLPEVGALWALQERSRLRAGFVSSAVRAGELLLAADDPAAARVAAERALSADPTSAPANRLAVAVERFVGDDAAAARAEASWSTALAALGLSPEAR